jgi:hypothetical protein
MKMDPDPPGEEAGQTDPCHQRILLLHKFVDAIHLFLAEVHGEARQASGEQKGYP